MVLPHAMESCNKPHPPGVMADGGFFLTAVFKVARELVETGTNKGVVLCHPFSGKVGVILGDTMSMGTVGLLSPSPSLTTPLL